MIVILNKSMPQSQIGETFYYEGRAVLSLIYSNSLYAYNRLKVQFDGKEVEGFSNLFFTVEQINKNFQANIPKKDSQKAVTYDQFFQGGGFELFPSSSAPVIDWQSKYEELKAGIEGKDSKIKRLTVQVEDLAKSKVESAGLIDKGKEANALIQNELNKALEEASLTREELSRITFLYEEEKELSKKVDNNSKSVKEQNNQLTQEVKDLVSKNTLLDNLFQQSQRKLKELESQKKTGLRWFLLHPDLHLYGWVLVCLILTVFTAVTFGKYFDFGNIHWLMHWFLCVTAAIVFEFSLIAFGSRGMKRWLNFGMFMQFLILGTHSDLYAVYVGEGWAESYLMPLVITLPFPLLGKAFSNIEYNSKNDKI